MRDQLLERVHHFLQAHGLLRPDALLLVAVSGGPDSLCLLHLLARLRDGGGPRLHLAHLDHGLRPAAAHEAAQVASLAAAWSVPATVERRPVRVERGDGGIMEAARRVRYAFLAETASAAAAHAVAVAHQADDQAETVLLHLLRGAGLAGLRGMREAVPWPEWKPAWGRGDEGITLIRPLLSTSRAEVEVYCAAHGLAPTSDPSNADERFARPRVRRLLRELSAENPRVAAALGRTAAATGDDYAFIQAELAARWPALAEERAGAVLLDRAFFAALHPALQRHAVRRAAAGLGVRELSFEQVEAARALAEHVGRAATLAAGLHLAVSRAHLAFTADAATLPYDAPQLPAETLPLPAAGVVELGGGWVCVVGAQAPAEPSPWWLGLDPAAVTGPLALRRRRAGDRFRPAGGRGSRKLQDFFVDQHVPQPLRDAWPLLVSGDAVLWVAGLRASEGAAAPPASPGTIWIGIVRR